MPDITLSLTDPQALRVKAALEHNHQTLLTNAEALTAAKEFLTRALRSLVFQAERDMASESVQDMGDIA